MFHWGGKKRQNDTWKASQEKKPLVLNMHFNLFEDSATGGCGSPTAADTRAEKHGNIATRGVGEGVAMDVDGAKCSLNQAVMARFGASRLKRHGLTATTSYWPGTISCVHADGTYNVHYEDETSDEENVFEEFIHSPSKKVIDDTTPK